jgi:hypothetical protein
MNEKVKAHRKVLEGAVGHSGVLLSQFENG